jgi:hypothetical protein
MKANFLIVLLSAVSAKFGSWKAYSYCDFAYYPLGVKRADNPDTYSQLDCEEFCKSIDNNYGQ